MPKSWLWWTTKLVDLDEGAGIEQQLEPLARRLLAGLVLAANPLLAAAELGLGVASTQLLETIRSGHGLDCSRESASSKVNGFIDFRRDLLR